MDVQHVMTFFLKIANSNHTIQFCIVTVNTNSKLRDSSFPYG